MRVAVLGSSGQIGAYLTEHLTKKGHLVREFDIVNGNHEDMTHIPNTFLRNIIMERYDDEEIINVGTGEDITIKELAEMIVEVSGYKNEYEWDTSKPNGTLRKVLDVDKIKSLGWEPEIGLKEGLESTYEWYKKSIGYEEVIHKISPFRRFMNWMDQ